MAGPAKAETSVTTETTHDAPIAHEVAQIFVSMLTNLDGVGIELYFNELTHVADRLIPHAQNLKKAIERNAFLEIGPTVELITFHGVDGDGPELGWIFEGNVLIDKKKIHTHVEKTDIWNGEGVSIGVFASYGEDSLKIWARKGILNSGRVDIVFTEEGKKHAVTFTKQPAILKEKPLVASV